MEARELPDEVLIQIFKRLHPLQLMRLQLVCKAWKQLVTSYQSPTSPSFSCSFPSSLGFIIESSGTLLYTDPFCCRWLPLPTSPSSCPATFHTSAHSLLCLSSTTTTRSSSHSTASRFHLWNPFTRTRFEVPDPPDRRPPFLVGLAHDPLSGSFKIVFAGRRADAERNRMYDVLLDLSARVFDSSSLQWRRISTVPAASMHYSNPIYSQGKVFWLSRKARKEVLVFSVDEEQWDRLGAPWPEGCYPYNLWDCEGQLLMVGEVSSVVTIWKLSDDPLEWVEIASLPRTVADVAQFCGERDVAGHGFSLCIMLVWARKGFMYDLRTASVRWLPFCPINSYSWGNVYPYMAGFSNMIAANSCV